MSMPATKTAARQNFLNGNPKVEVACKLPPSHPNIASFRYAFPGGTVWDEIISEYTNSPSVPTKWMFIKGGYLDAVVIGLSTDYQAELVFPRIIRVNAGVVQYYDAYLDIWISV